MPTTLRTCGFAALILISICLSSPARADAPPETDQGSETVIPAHFSVATISPRSSDGEALSALPSGATFTITVIASGQKLHDGTADLSALGLSSAVPLEDQGSHFVSEALALPSGIADGQKSVAFHAQNILDEGVVAHGTIAVDTVPPEGHVEATFVKAQDSSGTWAVQVAGSFDGTGSGARIVDAYTFGETDEGGRAGTKDVDVDIFSADTDSFNRTVPAEPPDITWPRMGFGIVVRDDAGHETAIESDPFPLLTLQPVVIDHAVGGSIVDAPNYAVGNIPSGVGIPHTLINSIPEGDYYAVVFFKGLIGCPSDNYEINSFLPDDSWDYDQRGPQPNFNKAYGTTGGGCMQEYHVNPSRDGDWLWGALSNTGTSSAIADMDGIPAFAICTTAATCDTITTRMPDTSPDDDDSATTASTTPPASGISSVLFLPGIKGSKLYARNPLCLVPGSSCDFPLWLPTSDLLVPKLFLDAAGKSLQSVYAKEGGILAHAFGRSFYDRFEAAMDSLASSTSSGAGWSWAAAAYDWRLSLADILNGGAERGGGVHFDEPADPPYLEARLRSLASTSPTGKVTIVAHSNGGLVAKALMQKLGDAMTSSLIDSVIFIGVPQSGAPRALAALLFGEGESLPGVGLIPELLMSRAHARAFALNSPMAYHLLPSDAYFPKLAPLAFPLVTFSSGAYTPEEAAYGSAVDTEDELRRYALADDGGRTMPAADDLTKPNILNASLLSYGETAHQAIDAWKPPEGVEVYEIGGLNMPTLSGIAMYGQAERSKDGTSTARMYRPLFMTDGDGTVPVTSALMMNVAPNVRHYYVNLAAVSRSSHAYDHGTLMEIPQVDELIGNILHKKDESPLGISESEVPAQPSDNLIFIAHSPVALSVSDSGHRTTGQDTEGNTSQEIPGSQAGTLGEDSYVIVPAGNRYTLRMAGTGTGSATLDIEEQENEAVTASSTIASIPVTPATEATLMVDGGIAHASALSVDEDGDGTEDFSVAPVLGETVIAPDAASGGTASEPSQPEDASGARTQGARSSRHSEPMTEAVPAEASSAPVEILLSHATEPAPATSSAKAQAKAGPKGYSLMATATPEKPRAPENAAGFRPFLLAPALRVLREPAPYLI